jgi:hypothetical protein
MQEFCKNNEALKRLKWAGFAVLFIFYASGFSAWNSNFPDTNFVVIESGTYLSATDNQASLQVDKWDVDFFKSPFQSAAENFPSSSEPEETEGKEDLKNNTFGKSFVTFLNGSHLIDVALFHSFSSYSEHFVKVRKVSLVILHHCWKCKLS